MSSQSQGAPATSVWLPSGGGLYVWPSAGIVRVTGADAREFLQNMVTNDVSNLASGEGCYSAFLTNKGKVLADFLVLCEGDGFDLISFYAPVAPLLEGLGRLIVSEDVALEDLSGSKAVFSLQGVGIEAVLPPSPPEGESRGGGVEGGGSVWTTRLRLGSIEVEAIRFHRFGVPGVEVVVSRDRAEEALDALSRLVPGISPVGEAEFEGLRIEAGWPRYGVDMDATNLLVETGLEDYAVSFDKGCYVGQEFVTRILQRGQAARHLRRLKIAGAGQVRNGDSVFLQPTDPKPCGEVRSVAPLPGEAEWIALAYVTTRHEDLSRVLVGPSADRLREATVEPLPVFRYASPPRQ
ncbi:MAG: folate-binding protein YgfZ [Nitrospirae bacterium]|nr:folate-binding protein YgfZ [Nitrospirota bacterium]